MKITAVVLNVVSSLSLESFQIQMGFSFPLLRANDLRLSLLIMRTRSFLTLLYVGDTYARLVYSWYQNIKCEVVLTLN